MSASPEQVSNKKNAEWRAPQPESQVSSRSVSENGTEAKSIDLEWMQKTGMSRYELALKREDIRKAKGSKSEKVGSYMSDLIKEHGRLDDATKMVTRNFDQPLFGKDTIVNIPAEDVPVEYYEGEAPDQGWMIENASPDEEGKITVKKLMSKGAAMEWTGPIKVLEVYLAEVNQN